MAAFCSILVGVNEEGKPTRPNRDRAASKGLTSSCHSGGLASTCEFWETQTISPYKMILAKALVWGQPGTEGQRHKLEPFLSRASGAEAMG